MSILSQTEEQVRALSAISTKLEEQKAAFDKFLSIFNFKDPNDVLSETNLQYLARLPKNEAMKIITEKASAWINAMLYAFPMHTAPARMDIFTESKTFFSWLMSPRWKVDDSNTPKKPYHLN